MELFDFEQKEDVSSKQENKERLFDMAREFFNLEQTPENILAFKEKYKPTEKQFADLCAAADMAAVSKIIRENQREDSDGPYLNADAQDKLMDFFNKLTPNRLVRLMMVLSYQTYLFTESKKED